MKYLFKNAYLISENRDCNFTVENGKMLFPATIDEKNYDQVIELNGRLVLKGFCDLHTHLDKAFISSRVTNESGTLDEAIAIMGRYKAQMTDEDIYARAEDALKMCYQNGTRYLRTHVDVDESIGLRSITILKNLQRKYQDLVQIQIVAFPQEGLVGKPKNIEILDQALAAGADLVGGIPANDQDPQEHIDVIFKLAQKYDVDIDMHIDETDCPKSMTLLQLADTTIKKNWQGRLTAGHCCSLAAKEPEEVGTILQRCQSADLKIISLPSTNLYLQGRNDRYNTRRGIAPIRRISQEFNIPTAIASDNMQDPFNPFGNGNLLEIALIAAHGCHMGGTNDLNLLFKMATEQPLEMFGVNSSFAEGQEAKFIILDAKTPYEAIINQRKLFASFLNGKIEM